MALIVSKLNRSSIGSAIAHAIESQSEIEIGFYFKTSESAVPRGYGWHAVPTPTIP
ncbi:hypothetical protein M378DRAFT_161653 [Amanita muscaria Koide BX008]|uniref:Uncharacterized protein n=1 Tax=Amanita muscaria (strain Koide BX008) TaxID=946122 RepID=A0A0C2SQW6_AMAMK|nr:hypothetical protein M378DRAFT_161653 [Amanita muscaria Koide BX008]